eukprot:610472-Karenia_brevis.AAC.1
MFLWIPKATSASHIKSWLKLGNGWSAPGLGKLITELSPGWKSMAIESFAKYLGFMIGPGAQDHSWQEQLTMQGRN